MKPLAAWLHPRRAAALIAEQRERLDALGAELDASAGQRAALADERDRALAEAAENGRRADLMHHKALELEKKVESLREERGRVAAAERGEIEAERAALDAFAARLEESVAGIEEMKRSYERRLSHLRHALADARAMLAARADYPALAEMTLINGEWGGERESAAADSGSGGVPDTGQSGVPAPGKEDSPSRDNADDDWLLPLP